LNKKMQHTLSGKHWWRSKAAQKPEKSNHRFSPVTNNTIRLSVCAQNLGRLFSCMGVTQFSAQLHLAKDPKISLEVILMAPVCNTAGITLYLVYAWITKSRYKKVNAAIWSVQSQIHPRKAFFTRKETIPEDGVWAGTPEQVFPSILKDYSLTHTYQSLSGHSLHLWKNGFQYLLLKSAPALCRQVIASSHRILNVNTVLQMTGYYFLMIILNNNSPLQET